VISGSKLDDKTRLTERKKGRKPPAPVRPVLVKYLHLSHHKSKPDASVYMPDTNRLEKFPPNPPGVSAGNKDASKTGEWALSVL
jgi:hypothetical protein